MARRPPPEHSRFKPGQSGNPGGRAIGTRARLNATFLNALADDFDKHGKKAIQNCREENPAAYVKALAGLLPKEVEVRKPLEDFNDDELIAAVRALQSYLAAQGDAAGADAPSEPAQTH
jgi:hypothetical protein